MIAKTNRRGIGMSARRFGCVAVATACLLPADGFGQQDSPALAGLTPRTIEEEIAVRELTRTSSGVGIGLGTVSSDSYKFGEYSGLKKQGPYLLGNIDFVKRSPYDSENANYWSLKGTSLGLASRNLRLEAGNQGNYKLWLEVDRLPQNQTESARTIFSGVGGANLTLPAGWAPITAADAVNTAAGRTTRAAKIDPFERTFDVGQERKNHVIGLSKFLSPNWELRASFKHEIKQGNKITGALIGNDEGNLRAVLIPEPVDYITNQFETTLEYSGAKSQIQLGYYLSLFNNRNNSLIWQNPYAAVAGWNPAAGFPAGQGQLGLSPDNRFHQLTASGGVNFTETTRLTGNLALGRMTQDQAFLPYTINPALAATTPLPRSSLEGRIDTTLANLNLTSRPLPKLNLRASYRYDERDNRTPQAQYLYIAGDSQNQQGVATDRARVNLPFGTKQNLLKLDGDYEIWRRTRLNAGYDYDEIKRTFSEVDRTREQTWRLGLRRSVSETFTGAINLAHSNRSGSPYNGNAPYLASYSPQFTGPQTAFGTQFENHPLLRKFSLADRDRDKLRFSVTLTPVERVQLQLSADTNRDNYRNSVLGLTDSNSASYSLDASFTPAENITAYAYYTYANINSIQKGREYGVDKAAQATPLASTKDWLADANDRIDTVGIGFKIDAITNKLDLGGEYLYSQSIGKIDVFTGPAIATAGTPLPDLKTRLNGINLYAKYRLQNHAALKVNILHQKFDSADWGLDNVVPATTPLVLNTGQLSPRYSVTVIGFSFSYRYW